MRRVIYFVLLSSSLGCVGGKKQVSSPNTAPKVSPIVASSGRELLLDGPRASLSSFCADGDASCSSAVVQPLSGGLLSYALLDNDGVFNSPRLALQTTAGWFVEPVQKSGFTPSHHEPSSTWFDSTKLTYEGGVFSIPRIFSHSVFVPGKGNEGASQSTSTNQYSCAVWEGKVQCKVQ